MELNYRGYRGVPLIGFAAYSGTGKTTLLIRLIPLLRKKGLKLAVVKHAHHDFDTDQPGKDSYELRQAGAAQMLVGSSRRSALIVEKHPPAEPGLQDLLPMLDTAALDLILVEGFKTEPFPKIELHRAAIDRPLRCQQDHNIVAVASDTPLPSITRVPVLDLNQPAMIVNFILAFVATPQQQASTGP